MDLILASSSPSRRAVLKLADIPFIVVPSEINETFIDSMTPLENVANLALLKAEHVQRIYPNDVIIGCDTLVLLEDQVLGKPASDEEAQAMLKILSGQVHSSITCVCILHRSNSLQFSSEVKIEFYPLNDDQIRSYLKRGEYLGKAGGYSIQEGAAAFTKEIHGNPTSVLGLPLSRLLIELRKIAPNIDGLI